MSTRFIPLFISCRLHHEVTFYTLEYAKMTWYYYGENSERNGPHSIPEMRAFVRSGIIRRETIVENANGESASAGTIQGFDFPPEPELESSSARIASTGLENQKTKSKSGEIKTEPLLPLILFAVIIGCIIIVWGIFWGIVGHAISGRFAGFLIGAYIGVSCFGSLSFWSDVKDMLEGILFGSWKTLCDQIRQEGLIRGFLWFIVLMPIVIPTRLAWDTPQYIIKHSLKFPGIAITGLKDHYKLILKRYKRNKFRK